MNFPSTPLTYLFFFQIKNIGVGLKYIFMIPNFSYKILLSYYFVFVLGDRRLEIRFDGFG